MSQIALAECSAANGVEIKVKAYLVQKLGLKNQVNKNLIGQLLHVMPIVQRIKRIERMKTSCESVDESNRISRMQGI